MAFGTRSRNHHVWDDAVDTLGEYGDRAHDLYNDGLSRAAGYLDHGRDLADGVYDRSRRRATDVYGESRHRVSSAADALAGRRSTDTTSIVFAAAAGVVAGVVLVTGLRWWLRQSRIRSAAPLEPARDTADDLFDGDSSTSGDAEL